MGRGTGRGTGRGMGIVDLRFWRNQRHGYDVPQPIPQYDDDDAQDANTYTEPPFLTLSPTLQSTATMTDGPNHADWSIAPSLQRTSRAASTATEANRCGKCCAGGMPDGGVTFSFVYSFLVIVIGIVFPVNESLSHQWIRDYFSASFLLYMFGMSIICLLLLEVYFIRQNRELEESFGTLTRQARGSSAVSDGHLFIVDGKAHQMNELSDTLSDARSTDGDGLRELVSPYATGLLLRIGLGVFGLIAMIYDGLLIMQFHEKTAPASCSEGSMIFPLYMHLAFLLVQTYFVIKHNSARMTSLRPLARLALAHVFATNIISVFRILVWRVYDFRLTEEAIVAGEYSERCVRLDDLYHQVAPYLFPFFMQYGVMAAAAVYSMFCDVGYRWRAPNEDGTNDRPASRSTLADVTFDKSYRGMFAGLVLLAATCVAIILFFAYAAKAVELPKYIYYGSDLFLHLTLFVALIVGWIRTRNLKYLKNPRFPVERILLLASSFFLFLYHVFRGFVQIQELLSSDELTIIRILAALSSLLAILICALQTCFVSEAMQRRAGSHSEHRFKPGRGSLTFLLITNLAIWAFRTLQIRELDLEGDSIERKYFGFLSWQVILFSLVPMTIFYYFVSASCLAHVWSEAFLRPRRCDTPVAPLSEQSNLGSWLVIGPTGYPVRVIEMRRRIKRGNTNYELDRIFSPVSEV